MIESIKYIGENIMLDKQLEVFNFTEKAPIKKISWLRNPIAFFK